MKCLGDSPELSFAGVGDSPRKNKGLSLLKQMMDKSKPSQGRI